MKDEIEKQLKAEIDHIFESGANEIRILEMVKTFIERRYQSLSATKEPSDWVSVEERLPEYNEEYLCAIDLEDGHDNLVVFACEFNVKTKNWIWSNTKDEGVSGTVLFWSEKQEPPIIEWKKTNPIYPVLSLDQQERLAYGQCVHGNNLANCSGCNNEDSVWYERVDPLPDSPNDLFKGGKNG